MSIGHRKQQMLTICWMLVFANLLTPNAYFWHPRLLESGHAASRAESHEKLYVTHGEAHMKLNTAQAPELKPSAIRNIWRSHKETVQKPEYNT